MKESSRVTLKEVAQEAGVSFSLVSQVLRNDPMTTKRESTRRKIHEAAAKLNYQHHAGARALRTGKSMTIGVMSRVTPVVTTAVETEQLIIEAIRKRGYQASLIGVGSNGVVNPDSDASTFDKMLSQRPEGVIINRLVASIYKPHIQKLQNAGIHVVAIGCGAEDGFDGLREDDRHGVFEATSHLIDLGYRRIMFLGYPNGVYIGFPLRLQGYKRAMAEAGLPVTDDLIKDLAKFPLPDENESQMGYLAMCEVIEQGQVPEAVFCSNDEVALGAMWALHSHGLQVPRDVALVGFDGIVLSGYGAVPLTTVKLPTQELADTAVDLLFKRIDGEVAEKGTQFHILKPELLIRESCGAKLRRNAL